MSNLGRYAHKSYNIGYKANGKLQILDESFEDEDEEETEFQTVVLGNIGTLLRAKNKFSMLRKNLIGAKAFIIGNSDINGENESSSDEDDDVGRNVTVFFKMSEQHKETVLKKAMLTLVKQAMAEVQRKKTLFAEAANSLIIGEGLDNQDEVEKKEEVPIVSASHSPSPSEDEGETPDPPKFPTLPPYNYKELKTIHYAKFFTSCIFTPEQ